MVSIYTLSDPRTGGIRYVGKTFELRNRYRNHNNEHSNTRKATWIKSLKVLGLKPAMDVLEEYPDAPETDWYAAEEFWISYLRFLGCPLTNLALGGRGGGRACIETRAKQSAIKSGRRLTPEHRRSIGRALTGYKHSPEYCARLSAALRGKHVSTETRAKLRLVNLGKKHAPRSAEHRAKMREIMRGKRASAETRLKQRLAKLGRAVSSTTRLKISQALAGKPKSRAHAIAAGLAQRGKKLRPESIARRTATRYGRPLVLATLTKEVK